MNLDIGVQGRAVPKLQVMDVAESSWLDLINGAYHNARIKTALRWKDGYVKAVQRALEDHRIARMDPYIKEGSSR